MTGSLFQFIRKALEEAPCERCGVEGGDRFVREERVQNRIVKRRLCSSCSKTVFFHPFTADPDRSWER